MNEVRNKINLLDEGKGLRINYTCRSNLLKLVFEFTDYELTSSDTVKLYIRTPSGNITNITGTKTGNAVSFQMQSTTFSEKGAHTGQLKVTKNSKQLYSVPMRLEIHPYYGGE